MTDDDGNRSTVPPGSEEAMTVSPDPAGIAALEQSADFELDAENLFEVINADIVTEDSAQGWLRSRSTRVRLLVFLPAAVGLLAVLTLLYSRRGDWSVYPALRLWLEGAALILSVAMLSRWALWPSYRPPVSRRFVVLGILLACLVPVVLSLLPMAHEAHPSSLIGNGDDFLYCAGHCLLTGLLAATPILIVMTLLDRKEGHGRIRALLFAAVSGLVGVFVLSLHCPITHRSHLLAGHGTVVLLLLGLWPLLRKALQARGGNSGPH